MGEAITVEFMPLSIVPHSEHEPESVSFEMPDSMHPSDRQFLIAELGKISAEVASQGAGHAGKFANLAQRLRAVDARIAKLELRADQSGQHNLDSLQKALDQTQAVGAVWRGRAWTVFATLLTTALIALVAYYLKG